MLTKSEHFVWHTNSWQTAPFWDLLKCIQLVLLDIKTNVLIGQFSAQLGYFLLKWADKNI